MLLPCAESKVPLLQSRWMAAQARPVWRVWPVAWAPAARAKPVRAARPVPAVAAAIRWTPVTRRPTPQTAAERRASIRSEHGGANAPKRRRAMLPNHGRGHALRVSEQVALEQVTLQAEQRVAFLSGLDP